MAYRLALVLGFPDVDEMLECIPARLWPEWVAFYELEPFGPLQEDIRAGQLTTITANVNRKKGAKAFKVQDFYPHLKETAPKPQSTKALWQAAKLWAMQHNAAVQRRPGRGKQ